MARNLQAKLPPTDTIRLFDINKDAMEKLEHEMSTSQAGGANVELAQTVVEASKDAVRCHFLVALTYPPSCCVYYDEYHCSIYDLSWGQ